MNRLRQTWDQVSQAAARWPIAGLGAASFVLRVSLESGTPWRVWGVGAAGACLLAGVMGRRLSFPLAPLNLLWVYVLWPAACPSLAAGLGFVATFAWLIASIAWSRRERSAQKTGARRPSWGSAGLAEFGVEIGVFLCALGLYIATLAPDVLPADSGEFQIVAPLLGVAHPPGYALFTLLGKLFSLLPIGHLAWRLNLMGAVSGALTLAIVCRTARRLAGTAWAGIVAASALGVSTTFWAQSTTLNIRMLTVLFTAWCCYTLNEFILAEAGSKPGARHLLAFAASWGFGIAHHSSLAFFAPVFAAIVLWHDIGIARRLRAWPGLILAFLAPFAVNLYVVARAVTGAPFGAGELVDAQRVLDHLLMRGFGGDMFAHLQWDRLLWERFLVTGNILRFQFGWALLLVAVVGFLWLGWRRPKQAALSGGMAAIMLFVVATYRAPQSVEYLMPAYVPIALSMGSAIAWFTHPPDVIVRWRRGVQSRRRGQPSCHLTPVLIALLFLPILALGRTNLPSYVLLHGDRSARAYAQQVLDKAPPDAHILSNWHWATPLWYLQLIENQRPDVTVEYIPPQGPTAMPYAWPERIAQALAESDRPLIVTNAYPTYIDLPYRFEPLGQAFLVRDQPSFEIPGTMSRVDTDLDNKIRIIGYRLDRASIQPGETLAVDVAWQPIAPLERDYAFFVHLIGADGAPLGQQDRRHDAAPTYAPGQVLIDRYEFPLLLQAAPGAYRLVAGAYITLQDGGWQRLTTNDGQDAVSMGAVSVSAALLPAVTTQAVHTRFAGGPTLTGVDYDDTLPTRRRVYLHWQAGEDDVLVRLVDGDRLLAQATVTGSAGKGAITTVLDVPPGTGDMRLALFTADGDQPLPGLGAWGRAVARPIVLPTAPGRRHYLPFGAKMALVGVSARGEWAAGTQARVALSWIGMQPIVHDYVVSVSVHGDDVIIPPSDWVPALGAIPTFKWVRGSRIVDVHLIDLPADASGEAEVSVGVYDAFVNQRALAPLDEQVMALGRPTVPLQTVIIQ